jgi:GTP-binding protein
MVQKTSSKKGGKIMEIAQELTDKEFLRLEPSFLWAARTMGDLPPMNVTEIAFAGRSNVGKSSLVNGILNRKGMARASSEPGRTKELIFFSMKDKDGEERLRIVDLPGYGYAKASKTEIQRWTSATRDFLKGRAVLKRVFVLIDGRHGIKENDLDILKELDIAAVSYQIVLTKIDKVKKSEFEAVVAKAQEVLKKRPAAHPVVLAVSAHEHIGLSTLRAEILSL